MYRWWIAVADSRDHPAGVGLLERPFFAPLDAAKASGERRRHSEPAGERADILSRWWRWSAGHEIPRLWARNDTRLHVLAVRMTYQ